MQKEFEQHIFKNNLFKKEDKILVAISGGVDSVVLAHLLKAAGFSFSLAHCNFQLRAKESELDEFFCLELAKKLKVPILVKRFDTITFCNEHKCSIQLGARKLRYQWFNELLQEQNFDLVLTAHHANDVLETMIINLLRGTGIKGLKGIPARNNKVARPLLIFKKIDLELFAKKEAIKYRTDKSNYEDKYERNFIRNKIVPLLKQLNPQLEETFLKNSFHFNQEAGIVQEFLKHKASEYSTQTSKGIIINKNRLKHEHYIESILHHLIGGLGFNATQQKNIIRCIVDNAEVGKIFTSPGFRLVVDRNDLIIKKDGFQKKDISVTSLRALKKQSFLKITSTKKFTLPLAKEIVINPNKLVFPITFRRKQIGDKFKPFGMKGFKLLSDFMKEAKMNVFEKENCLLMVNGNGEIIWVMAHRSDNRYKVELNETDLLKIKFIE